MTIAHEHRLSSAVNALQNAQTVIHTVTPDRQIKSLTQCLRDTYTAIESTVSWRASQLSLPEAKCFFLCSHFTAHIVVSNFEARTNWSTFCCCLLFVLFFHRHQFSLNFLLISSSDNFTTTSLLLSSLLQ